MRVGDMELPYSITVASWGSQKSREEDMGLNSSEADLFSAEYRP